MPEIIQKLTELNERLKKVSEEMDESIALIKSVLEKTK